MTAYWLARARINDPVEYAKYVDAASAAIVRYGGRFLARGGELEILEGSHEFCRFVVIEFPSIEAARECHRSPEYANAAAFRRDGAGEVHVVVVEGIGEVHATHAKSAPMEPVGQKLAHTRSDRRRAIVVGGSISGLFAAAFLRKIGWQVDIYERSGVELKGRGAGIFVSHVELLNALEQCGAGTAGLGVTAHGRITLDRNGNVIAKKPMLQLATSWDRLHTLLWGVNDPRHYHLGRTFKHVEQDSSGVVAHFSNGVSERADLLIACDGWRSAVRSQLAPHVQPIYAGYYLWRGAPNEADLSPATRGTLFPNYSFFVGDQLQVLGYPIPGSDDGLLPGQRRYNFVWFRVASARELREMCVDEQGTQHELSMPPPLVRKDLIERMRIQAAALLPPQFFDCLQNIRQPFFTPVTDFYSESLVFGRVVLLGDAASTARPHVGFGTAKAGADAQALADALCSHDDINRALAAYQAERQPIGKRVVLHSRKLGTQLGVGIKTEEDREMSILLQQPDQILKWVAAPDFLTVDG